MENQILFGKKRVVFEKGVPGARGFRIIFSQFAYVYGVFGFHKCRQGLWVVIGSSIQRLVGLWWAVQNHDGFP